jgi:cellulose synthase/poly-beta-1,6-N-acetylglucosamine synthase-like glycosyltransferase
MIAFRNLVRELPKDIGADEDWLRWRLESLGHKVAYAPTAVVRNRTPATFRELVQQRVRNNVLMMDLQHRYGFRGPTLNTRLVVRAAFRFLRHHPQRAVILAAAAGLEAYIRVQAWLNLAILRREPTVNWQAVPSTKNLVVNDPVLALP